MKVNGKDVELSEEMTLEILLDQLRVNKDKIVVELDGSIISKEDYFVTKLKESNIIEVINFVGGG